MIQPLFDNRNDNEDKINISFWVYAPYTDIELNERSSPSWDNPIYVNDDAALNMT